MRKRVLYLIRFHMIPIFKVYLKNYGLGVRSKFRIYFYRSVIPKIFLVFSNAEVRRDFNLRQNGKEIITFCKF